MDLGIKDKNAIVLASSKGLGRGVAEALADEGANVLLVGRSADLLAQVTSAINQKGRGKADYLVADISDPNSPAMIEAAAMEKLGSVDILVNNTGGPPPGPMCEADLSVFASQFETMVMRVMDLTARIIPQMRERKWGRVLTLASSGVQQPIPNLGLSNAIRSALVGWSKSMSNELAGEGITFNMLLPGRINTDRLQELDAANAKRNNMTIEDVTKTAISTIPVGRYGDVEEFASTAAFLVSERASYITGSLIRCDGGATKSI